MPDWNPLGFINFPTVLQTPMVRDFVSTLDTYLTPKEMNWSDEMAKKTSQYQTFTPWGHYARILVLISILKYTMFNS